MPESFHAHFLRNLNDHEAASLRDRSKDTNVRLTLGSDIPTSHPVHLLIAGRLTETQLKSCGNSLKYLIIPWAGIPEQTREMMLKYPEISVHNLHHNAVPTAEMAVALLLAAAKVIVPLDQRLRRGDWSARYEGRNDTILLADKNALVLGFGSIGKHVATILSGMQMNVNAIARSVTTPRNENGVELHPPDRLRNLLPATQALIICVPLTEETRNMIGQPEFDLLPPGTILSNVARGTVVNEHALFTALKSRRLHAAGLDVWYQYPSDEPSRASTLPSQYPFHELENVVLSPHRGGAVGQTEAENLRWDALAKIILAAAMAHAETSGDARHIIVPDRVNLKRGY